MPDREQIKQRVRALVAELAPSAHGQLQPNSRLVEDLSLDSVTILELVVTLEDEFDLPPLNPTDSFSITTLEHLEELVADLVMERM